MDAKKNPHRFEFARDSFAFANELVWEYLPDAATGKTMAVPRCPKPEYHHRCFALVRVVRQFFYHARFAADQPEVSGAACRRLVRAVMARSRRTPSQAQERIVIPGFAGLREFSRSHEKTIKVECGGAWRSYFLRSHWRMIFPFSRTHQARTAEALTAALGKNILPILHLIKFPALTINHAIILFGVMETRQGWEFDLYDPNNPVAPARLLFDRAARTFILPANACWLGGELNVSHICRSWYF
jgi:hypothetical protein